MGIFRRIKNCKPHRDINSKGTNPIVLEKLEPRILLSGDSLLYAATSQLYDPLDNNAQQITQYAELLDTDAQAEEQVSEELASSDTPNSDVYKPIFTLFPDDNTNGESVNADLSVGIVSSTQVNSEPGLQVAGSDIGIALVLGVDLFEENGVQPIGEDVDSGCFESCQRQLIIEQLTDTLRVPHGPPGADGVLTSLDDVRLEYVDAGGQMDLVIRLNTQNSTVIEVFDNSQGTLLASHALSEINSLVIVGGDNSDDTLTVDLSNPFSIPGGIIFAGGDGGYDKLVLNGNSELTAEYFGQGDDNGTVIVSGEEGATTNVSYSGLEPFVYLNEFESIVIAEDEILSGSGVYTGDLINYGTISPGNSPGIITINGVLTIVGTDPDTIDDSYTPIGTDTVGTIQIEIGGLNPGPGAVDPSDPDYDNGYDQIIVNGDVTLGGTLEIVLLGDFIPSEVNTFDILTINGSVDGAFDNAIGLFGFGNGLLFFDVEVVEVEVDNYIVQLVVKKAPGAGNIISSTQAINDILGQFYSDYFTIDSSITVKGELTIDDFVTLSGSFTFGVDTDQTVTVATGLPADATELFDQFGSTITGVNMLTLTIGATDVHVFVGLNAPYWTGDVDEDGKIDKADEDLNGDGLLNNGIENPLLDESADDKDYNGDDDKDDVINEDLDGDGYLDVDETNPDALGLSVTNLDIGFVLMKPLDPVWALYHPLALFYSLKATAVNCEFVGWDEIILSAKQIEINVNGGVPWPLGLGTPVVDFATSFPDTDGDGPDQVGFEVETDGDPVCIDFSSKKIGFSSERITVQLSQFVYITGSFAFEKGPATSVNIATGLPADALDALELLLNNATDTDLGTKIKGYATVIPEVQVSTFQIGASNVHAFVGWNGPYWEKDLDGDGEISWAFDTSNSTLFPDVESRTITDMKPGGSVTIGDTTYYEGTVTLPIVVPINTIVTAADGWIEIGGVRYGDINYDGFVDANETQELSEDAIGLVVNNLDIGFVTMAPTIGSFAQFFGIPKESLKGIIPKFTALKATADTLRFVGWDEIELSADMITINYQNGTEWLGGLGPPVVDFLNSFPGDPAGFKVNTGGVPVYIDFDGNQRIGFSSERITLRLSEFIHITGSFAFEMGPVMDVNIATGMPSSLLSLLGDAIDALSGTTAGTAFVTSHGTMIKGVEVSTLQVGASDVHAFVGLNGPYWEDDLDGDGEISWAFNTGDGDETSRTINAITDLDGAPLESVNISGATYYVDEVLPDHMVVTLSGSELVTVNGVTYGDIDGDGVVDANETQELSEEAVGLVVNDLDFGFVMMEPTIASFLALLPIPEHILKAIIPKFMALKATADTVEFVGVDEVQFSLQGITINYNNGSEWPGGLGPPVVDFTSSFESSTGAGDGYFEVQTGDPANPVRIDFDGNQRIGAIVEKVTLQISEFVHVTGSIAFEMGPVQTVDVTGGLLTGLTSEAIAFLDALGLPTEILETLPAGGAESTELSFMTIGASNVHAFVGLDGPYWVDDIDDDNNISWAFDTRDTTLFPDEASRTITAMETGGSVTIGATTYNQTTVTLPIVVPVNTVVTLTDSDGWIQIGSVKYGDINDNHIVDANETAELSEKAAGIVINDFDFGMAIMTPTFPLDFARYFALRATAEQIALVGIEDVTLEATHLLVEVNLSSPSIYGLPLFPVINFAGTEQFASEQLALFDTTPGGEITVGELRVLHGDAATDPTSFSTTVGELYATTALETDIVSLDRVVEVLDTDLNGILEVSEAQVLATVGTAALDADVDGDGKIDPLGYEVGTGGEPVYLSMDSPLIRAQGFVELDLFGVVTLIGNFAFELGPTITDPILTDSSVLNETLTTLTIGATKVFGFIGWDGPYFVDGNNNQQIDVDEYGNPLPGEANPEAVGLALSDLNVGILVAASLTSLDAFVAVDFEIDQIGIVGLDDFLTASATLALELNVGGGLNSGLEAIDFLATFPDEDEDGPDQAGFEVNTGDLEAPVLLDFDEVLVSIELAGELTIANTVSMLGTFFLETDGQSFKLFATADLEIGPDIGRRENSLLDIQALGVVSINKDGFAADFAINLDIGIEELGLSVAARVLINTTGADQAVIVPDRLIDFLEASTSPLAEDVLNRLDNNSYLISGCSPTFIQIDGTPDLAGAMALLGLSEDAVMFETTPSPYAVVVLYGSFDFVGFVTANGMGAIALRSGAFEMLVDIDYNFVGLTFNATGALGLFDDGISVYLDTSLDANILGVFHLQADGTLDINTRDTGSEYFSLEFSGDLSLLSVINLSTEGSIEVKDGWWTAQLSVSGSFLKLINVSGSAFISSEGEFEFIVDGSVYFGWDGFNIGGSAHLEVSYLDSNGIALGGVGPKILNVEGWVTGTGEIFWIGFTIFKLGVSYNSATGDIKLSVGPVPVPAIGWYCFWGICVPYPTIKWKYYTFTIGTLKVVAQPPQQIELGQVDDGTLRLYVGPEADKRNLCGDELDEDVLIEHVSGNAVDGEQIRITMFGHSQVFDNVFEILIPDMADGEDSVEIRAGVTIPVEAHLGDDDDILISHGSGIVTAYGDEDNDRLEGGSANDQLFGGTGKDTIDGKAGDDWIEGGGGADVLIGGVGNDTIIGGGGVDLIAGDLTLFPPVLDPPDLVADSQDVDSGGWNLGANDEITDATVLPHISILGTGNGTFDYYSFTVTGSNQRGIFDIDAENFNTQLFLYDSNGNLLTHNDDNGSDLGNGTSGASLIDFVFPTAGIYIIGVGKYASFNVVGQDDVGQIGGNAPDEDDYYTLHISLEGHALNSEGTDPVSELEPNQPLPPVQPDSFIFQTTDTETGGEDILEGGDGDDILLGGPGKDQLKGDDGRDILVGDDGVVTISETEILVVTRADADFSGDDSLEGGNEDDVVFGGRGNDELKGDDGEDILVGDDGWVTIEIGNENEIDVTLQDVDYSGNDIIDGGADNDMLYGQKGEDILHGGGGDDHLYGDEGDDCLEGGSGNDWLFGGAGDDDIYGGTGSDSIYGDSGNDLIYGNEEDDEIHGGSGEDDIYGGTGDDTIYGDEGNDLIEGNEDNDTIYGGSGNDILLGDTGIVELDNGSLVSVNTEGETIGGSDTIHGDTGNDIIIGGVNGSSDTLYGDIGDDIILGDNGFINFNLDGDLTTLDLICSATDGRGGDDVIYGNAGDDVLIGGTGGDSIDGNGGKDLILGDNGVLTYMNGDTTNPRFRVLEGTVIYGETLGVDDGLPLIDRDSQFNDPDPAGIPQWANWEVTLSVNSGGADYIAGGPDNDQIFGQGGNDIIQGDGSILTTVNADRDDDGLLVVNASVEGSTDGDDYIEGNEGNDIIFGNLGQDDIIGGSSELFGLDTAAKRTDGEDLIFGGAGTELMRNEIGNILDEGDASHGRDSDMILGDNGNIFRIIGTDGFNYDDSYDEAITVRAAELLDYTPGGVDYDAVNAANDIGAPDEIHGESGDDFLYGMKGDDVIFGEGQDDDIIGGYGHDWISGGTGEDGVLGDDGRIYTSRNGTAEPLYGIDDLAGELDKHIRTPDKKQQATINVSGQLKKTVNLTPFKLDDFDPLQADDIIFGGWGNDFLHGGDGDDAISGAEALAEYYDNPVNEGDVLKFGKFADRAGEFGAYNKDDPLSKVYWNPDTGEFVTDEGVEFLLNFDHTEGPAVNDVNTDGDDVIFGDLGNDWLVGGTGRDHLYGGRGSDLLNADDYLDTDGGTNSEPDGSETSYEDLAYGGAGPDVLIANIIGDRLIDWVGDFNTYVLPYTSFGANTISRNLKPKLYEFLYDLSRADGADQTLGDPDDPRNGEPDGELGLVSQKDPDWEDQQTP